MMIPQQLFIQVDTERHEMYDFNKQREWEDTSPEPAQKARPMAV